MAQVWSRTLQAYKLLPDHVLDAYDHLTIEPDCCCPPSVRCHGDEVAVYGWGEYEAGSILAGQQCKSHVDEFATAAEALAAYPRATVHGGKVDAAPISFMHLPDHEMSAREEEDYFYGDSDY